MKLEVVQNLLFDDVVVQIRDEERHVVAPDVDAGEIDRRTGQSENIGSPSARSFDLAQIGDDIFLNEFLNELGDGRNADVQLFGKLRERTLTITAICAMIFRLKRLFLCEIPFRLSSSCRLKNSVNDVMIY